MEIWLYIIVGLGVFNLAIPFVAMIVLSLHQNRFLGFYLQTQETNHAHGKLMKAPNWFVWCMVLLITMLIVPITSDIYDARNARIPPLLDIFLIGGLGYICWRLIQLLSSKETV